VIAGVNLNTWVPGCTTILAIYEEVTNPIDSETTYEPLKFFGEAASKKPLEEGMVSIVKYEEPLGLINIKDFKPEIFSPIDPDPYSCVYV
jgi:hypothetical protein